MHFINQVRLDISIKTFLRVNKENVAFSHLPAQLHYSFPHNFAGKVTREILDQFSWEIQQSCFLEIRFEITRAFPM